MVQLLQITVWRFYDKLNAKFPYDSAIPFLGILPQTVENRDLRQILVHPCP